MGGGYRRGDFRFILKVAQPPNPRQIKKFVYQDSNPDPRAVGAKNAPVIEAREAFAAGNLPQAEYEQAVRKYMYSLHGREMWTEAANNLRKQLEECPDNMKKYIGYELKSIDKLK